MTSRIRLVGLFTEPAKQQHRALPTKLCDPSLWEVSIDPLGTPEVQEPLRGAFGRCGNQKYENNRYLAKNLHGLGAKESKYLPDPI